MRCEIPEKNIARCEIEKYITSSTKDSPKSLFQKGLIQLGSLYGRNSSIREADMGKIKTKSKIEPRKAKINYAQYLLWCEGFLLS